MDEKGFSQMCPISFCQAFWNEKHENNRKLKMEDDA
jgi:hypothetical protein